MQIPSPLQGFSQQQSSMAASNTDGRVRDTYRSLLGLPVPDRFIELVQSYPEQEMNSSGNKDRQLCLSIT
jgi:hypothetical protein